MFLVSFGNQEINTKLRAKSKEINTKLRVNARRIWAFTPQKASNFFISYLCDGHSMRVAFGRAGTRRCPYKAVFAA